jgi:hypothetical protein
VPLSTACRQAVNPVGLQLQTALGAKCGLLLVATQCMWCHNVLPPITHPPFIAVQQYAAM